MVNKLLTLVAKFDEISKWIIANREEETTTAPLAEKPSAGDAEVDPPDTDDGEGTGAPKRARVHDDETNKSGKQN